jgi:hypothetical protein
MVNLFAQFSFASVPYVVQGRPLLSSINLYLCVMWQDYQPVGLEESKRKSDRARADFDDFEGQ